MRAVAGVPAHQEVKLLGTEEPRIESPAQVKVRVLEVGVCGTDKEICAFSSTTTPPQRDLRVHRRRRSPPVALLVSPADVAFPGGGPSRRGLLVRDPDGHALRLLER